MSPFPTVCSKDLYYRHEKSGLVWDRVNSTENINHTLKELNFANRQNVRLAQAKSIYRRNQLLSLPRVENIMRKGENVYQHVSPLFT